MPEVAEREEPKLWHRDQRHVPNRTLHLLGMERAVSQLPEPLCSRPPGLLGDSLGLWFCTVADISKWDCYTLLGSSAKCYQGHETPTPTSCL